MRLPAYPEYRESGVNWLGKVPAHWEVRRLKVCISLLSEKAQETDFAVSLENVERGTGKFMPSNSECEGSGVMFETGDILFGKLRPYLAKVYLTCCAGRAVGDFFILRPSYELDGKFIQLQILNELFIDTINSSTFGSKMARASWEALANSPLLHPPFDEQTAIATFLDRETGKIDALIAAQEKLLALLAEKRQATISHAVTRGLNPDAPMKDSGIAWLGKVPTHWAIQRLKYPRKVFPSNVDKRSREGESAVKMCNYKDVYYNEIIAHNIDFMWATASAEQEKKFTLKAGDTLITKDSETAEDIAIAAYVPKDLPRVICGYHL